MRGMSAWRISASLTPRSGSHMGLALNAWTMVFKCSAEHVRRKRLFVDGRVQQGVTTQGKTLAASAGPGRPWWCAHPGPPPASGLASCLSTVKNGKAMHVSYTVCRLAICRMVSCIARVRQCPPSRPVQGLTDPRNVTCFRAEEGKHIRGQTCSGGGRTVEESGFMDGCRAGESSWNRQRKQSPPNDDQQKGGKVSHIDTS